MFWKCSQVCDLSGLSDPGLELDEGEGWESTGNLIMLKGQRDFSWESSRGNSVVIRGVKEAEVGDFQKNVREGLKDSWLHSLCEWW